MNVFEQLDSRRALAIAGGMLLLALLLRGSLLGAIVAGAAAVPSAWAMWTGAQEDGQRTYGYALVAFLGSLGLALLLLLLWLFG